MIKIIKKILIILLILFEVEIMTAERHKISAEENKVLILEKQLKENPDDTDLLLRLGIAYFQQFLDGIKEFGDKAKKIFEKVISKNSKNSIAHTLYGKLLCYEGQNSWYPVVNMTKTNIGIEEMHIGVQLDPDNVYLRLLRGSTLMELPRTNHSQTQVALEDLNHIVKIYKEEPSRVSKSIILDTYLNLLKLYLDDNNLSNAKENYNKIIETDSNSEQAIEAKNIFKNRGIVP